ncbi:MAG: class I SAM-dependent methyltransferase [bacterium]|jgi:16S rRNA (guanine1516-N2)-methyltransferase
MKKNNTIITTSHNPPAALISLAEAVAKETGAVFASRRGRSLAEIAGAYQAAIVVTVTRQGMTAWSEAGQFTFHPGTAKLRLLACRQGKPDKMGQAMGLQPGDKVLDCTLGLANDAIVASFLAGPRGAVCGLESETVIASIVRHGLAAYQFPELPELAEAMRRITVINAEHSVYLAGLPDESFDVIYFDPMFRTPVKTSPGMNALRWLTNDCPLTPEAIAHAIRVARRRVVMKERNGSTEFDRLGFRAMVGAKGSRIVYGYIDK